MHTQNSIEIFVNKKLATAIAIYFYFVEEEIDGKAFLKLDKSDFKELKLTMGTAKKLEDIINEEKVARYICIN